LLKHLREYHLDKFFVCGGGSADRVIVLPIPSCFVANLESHALNNAILFAAHEKSPTATSG
jgi:hypothetical protein